MKSRSGSPAVTKGIKALRRAAGAIETGRRWRTWSCLYPVVAQNRSTEFIPFGKRRISNDIVV